VSESAIHSGQHPGPPSPTRRTGDGAIEARLSGSAEISFLAGGGEMRNLIRAFDWAQTSIGAMDTWSPSLRMMTAFLLANRFPLLLWWGPEYISIYNDAYRPILGAKHPNAVGRPFREVWPEIDHVLRPLIDAPFNGGPATWMDDILLEVNRHGFTEETHFTIAYSPVPDDTAPRGIGGVLATVHEITEKIVGERRIAALRDLGARAGEGKTAEEACSLAALALESHDKDIPFALFYLLDAKGENARLAAAAGVGLGEPASPVVIDLRGARADTSWPVVQVVDSQVVQVLESIATRFSVIPPGPWSDPPRTAVLLPIKSNVAHQLAGVLVAGISARLKLDDSYLGFLDLVATQIASAIGNARAYEQERKRSEALAEIDRAKTMFFSNVSHEFRTPLTLMLGPLEDALARSAGLPAEEREGLNLAHRNSLRLLKLVNTLLDFSRIEAGRIQASYEPLDLAVLTAELASVFRSAIEKAGLELIVDCAPLPEPAFIDCEMWEKIVLNLISNAFKFTFDGAITVALRATTSHFELAVRDTGTGIPAEEIPKLFERFHRVAGARGRTHEGSGIGLALVQELARLHGGSVSVETVYGAGSTFRVIIPRGSGHLPAQHIRALRTQSSTALGAKPFVEEALRWLPDAGSEQQDVAGDVAAAEHRGARDGDKRARIVLADDNADMRDYLARLLGTCYEVEPVADGEAALAAIDRAMPDLVLADIMMPRLDGLQLVARLRGDPPTRTLPIVLLSARAGEEARAEGLATGADAYLVKPFGARELLAHVAANIQTAKVRREAEQALRQRTAQFEILLNQAPLGVYLVDADFRVRQVNPTALPMFGDIPDLIGRDFAEVMHILWPKEYADEIVRLFRRTLDTGEPYETTERGERRRDRGVTEFYAWRIDRIVLPEDRHGVVCYFRDIAAEVEARQTQQLLVDELNHRVKNTLASVQAIVQHTLRSAKDPAKFAANFAGRIQSMSRVHSLLTSAAWKGADLREVIRDQLLLGTVDESRLTAWGPVVHLEPRMALHVALMLHELGTNSSKYGALSGERGWVTIAWTVEDGLLRLRWAERGGPAVSAPTRRGFGTTLIEQSAGSEGGNARMSIVADGILWEITIPLPRSAAPDGTLPVSFATGLIDSAFLDEEGSATDKRPGQLAGRRFLVVEDEPLVALDLIAGLEEAGGEVVGQAGTSEEALAFVEGSTFDVALLDGNLRGRPVDDIAAALTRRNVPFIFVTGYGRESLPRAFAKAPVLGKPFSLQQLLEAAGQLLADPVGAVRLRE
jgi:PAS domain S-box-containing protein